MTMQFALELFLLVLYDTGTAVFKQILTLVGNMSKKSDGEFENKARGIQQASQWIYLLLV